MSSSWPVLARSLRDLRWTIFWYGLGLGLYAAVTVWTFPAIEESLRSIELPQELLKFFGSEITDLARPSAYLSTRYQSFAPVVLSIFAVLTSTGLLAGEEGRGALEVVAAQPITRARLALEKMAAFLVACVLICALLFLGWVGSVPFVDLHGDVSLLDAARGTVLLLPIAAAFGGLGFLLAAVTPTRGTAAGLLTALAISSYLGGSFARVAEPVEWMQYLSLYYYADADTVLTGGVVPWHLATLLLVAALSMLGAVLAFEDREIGVRRWQLPALRPRRAPQG